MADFPATTIRLVLPSTAGLPVENQAWVLFLPDVLLEELDPTLPIGEAERMLVAGKDAITQTLVHHIADWNLESRAGTNALITPENIGKLSIKDCTYLVSKLRLTKTLSKDQTKRVVSWFSTVSDGKTPSHPPPLSYQLYSYRKRHGISYPDLMKTPYSVMLQDLQFEEFERTFIHKPTT